MNTYREKADKTFDETVKLYEEVRQLPKPDVALKTVSDHAKDTPSLAMTVGNNVSEVNVNLENIPTTDIIHFHRETSDILYTRLLRSTLQVSKLETNKKKAQDLLRKERVENKTLQIKIKNLHDELLKVDWKLDKGAMAQKLLDEKEKEVQVLKRKLKIPSTQFIQTFELTEFEKEKEALNIELTDYKDKLLNLEEK